MKYSEDVFSRAAAELDKRRNDALEENKKRIAETEKKYPEIAAVNKKLAEAVTEISKAMNVSNVYEAVMKIAQENIKAQQSRNELLVAFGYKEDHLEPPYYCKKCGDTGFVEGRRCECLEELLKKYSVEELNENCRISLRDFSEFTLDHYSGDNKEYMKDTFELCKRYAEEFSADSESIFFMGGTGLGKTFLSSAIAKRVIEKGYNVAYDSISNFLRKIEDEHFGRSEGRTMDILLSADLLILDDLGSEFRSSFNDSAIYDIINSRINYGLPTIISTNLSIKELNSHYNERIVSRLLGMFLRVELRGKDIRLQIRMNK